MLARSYSGALHIIPYFARTVQARFAILGRNTSIMRPFARSRPAFPVPAHENAIARRFKDARTHNHASKLGPAPCALRMAAPLLPYPPTGRPLGLCSAFACHAYIPQPGHLLAAIHQVVTFCADCTEHAKPDLPKPA